MKDFNITAEQALLNLYSAARMVNASAEIHESLRQSYELLALMVADKPQEKVK